MEVNQERWLPVAGYEGLYADQEAGDLDHLGDPQALSCTASRMA
jgi:hypothetical protein